MRRTGPWKGSTRSSFLFARSRKVTEFWPVLTRSYVLVHDKTRSHHLVSVFTRFLKLLKKYAKSNSDDEKIPRSRARLRKVMQGRTRSCEVMRGHARPCEVMQDQLLFLALAGSRPPLFSIHSSPYYVQVVVLSSLSRECAKKASSSNNSITREHPIQQCV